MIFTGELVAFEHTDEDEYALSYWDVEDDAADNPVEIRMTTSEAVSLFLAVEKVIGGHVAEMRAAKREYDSGVADDPSQQAVLDHVRDDDSGYDFLDPKHPTYAERMAHAADVARKQAKGE